MNKLTITLTIVGLLAACTTTPSSNPLLQENEPPPVWPDVSVSPRRTDSAPILPRLAHLGVVAIADDAPVVVSYFKGRPLQVIDARDGRVERSIAEPLSNTRPWQVDVNPAGELIAILSWDNRVWLWKWRDEPLPRPVATLPGLLSPESQMRGAAIIEFAPGGDRLLVGHGLGGLLLLSSDGEWIATLHEGRRRSDRPAMADRDDTNSSSAGNGLVEPRPSGWEVHRSWTSDGQVLALATIDGPCLFDAGTGERVASGFDIPGEALVSVALNAEGTRLATGHWTGIVTLHDARTRERLWTYTHIDPSSGGHGDWENISVGDLAFGPDGDLLAVTVDTLIFGLLLDARTGERLWLGPPCGGRMGHPAGLVWFPSGHSFLFAYVSIGEIWQVLLGPGAPGAVATQVMREEWGTLPDTGWNELAVYLTDHAVRAVDPTWKTLWRTHVQ